MIKKMLFSIGILFLRNSVSANQQKIYMKEDLEISLKKHLICVQENLNKIIKKDNFIKIDEKFYDLNDIMDRYTFINEQRNYINFELCDKYSTYVISILESMYADEKNIDDWKQGYTYTVIATELSDIVKHKKAKEFKNDFSKNRKNSEIEKNINERYEIILKEDAEKEKKKDISSDRDIF